MTKNEMQSAKDHSLSGRRSEEIHAAMKEGQIGLDQDKTFA
jgi:hypothetical protein